MAEMGEETVVKSKTEKKVSSNIVTQKICCLVFSFFSSQVSSNILSYFPMSPATTAEHNQNPVTNGKKIFSRLPINHNLCYLKCNIRFNK